MIGMLIFTAGVTTLNLAILLPLWLSHFGRITVDRHRDAMLLDIAIGIQILLDEKGFAKFSNQVRESRRIFEKDHRELVTGRRT